MAQAKNPGTPARFPILLLSKRTHVETMKFPFCLFCGVTLKTTIQCSLPVTTLKLRHVLFTETFNCKGVTEKKKRKKPLDSGIYIINNLVQCCIYLTRLRSLRADVGVGRE